MEKNKDDTLDLSFDDESIEQTIDKYLKRAKKFKKIMFFLLPINSILCIVNVLILFAGTRLDTYADDYMDNLNLLFKFSMAAGIILIVFGITTIILGLLYFTYLYKAKHFVKKFKKDFYKKYKENSNVKIIANINGEDDSDE